MMLLNIPSIEKLNHKFIMITRWANHIIINKEIAKNQLIRAFILIEAQQRMIMVSLRKERKKLKVYLIQEMLKN